MVAMRHLRMMRRLAVIAGLVVLGGFAMMLGRLLVMMRGLFVVLVDLVVVQIFAVHRQLRLLKCSREHCRASMKQLRPQFVSSRRFPQPSERVDQILSQTPDDRVPIAKARLTPELRARIPWPVAALAQPAEIGGVRQKQKKRLADRAGEMRNGGVDGDHGASAAMAAAVSAKSAN